jgi:hypothetical protein
MDIYGDVDLEEIEADIIAYMNTLLPGQTLYRSKLQSIAIDAGADGAVFGAPETPAADVTCTNYEVIRPGSIALFAGV